jgi:hypothetical protein
MRDLCHVTKIRIHGYVTFLYYIVGYFGAYVCVLSDFRDGFLAFRVWGNVTMLRNMNTLFNIRTYIKMMHFNLGLNFDNNSLLWSWNSIFGSL